MGRRGLGGGGGGDWRSQWEARCNDTERACVRVFVYVLLLLLLLSGVGYTCACVHVVDSDG